MHTTYSIVIIDDDHGNRNFLKKLITAHCPQLQFAGEANDVDQAVELIQSKKPDILFLDIELPSGTGFDIINKTKEHPYKVILTSGHDHYALLGFKFEATSYLLKPICEDELVESVNKTCSMIQSNILQNSGYINTLINQLHQTLSKKVQIPCKDGFMFLDTTEIIRIEADSNYTHFFLENNKKVTACKTLKEIENQLNNPDFIRVHNAHVVNRNKIKKYIKGNGGAIILQDGSEVPVSRSQKSHFLASVENN